MNTKANHFSFSANFNSNDIHFGAPISPLLSTPQLCNALARYLDRQPCARTIQRWVQNGMPYHARPRARGRGGRVQRWFLLGEVYTWLVGSTVSRNLAQEAVDLGHRRPVRKRAA